MTMPDSLTSEPTTLDTALAYARRGWRVIPIPPGQKHPAIPAWQTAGSTDETRIRHWWGNAPDHGIGIVTGPESGIWVLDVDIADGKRGDDTLADLQDAYSALPDTYEVQTGSGGRHLYFRWPAGQTIRNNQSGTLGPGLDIRGLGGQVLAPPTIHPNGQPYTLEASAAPNPADAPPWLLALLDRTDTRPAERPASKPAGDRPGDRWAADTTWAQLLEPDGWTYLGDGPDGEQRWVRPGKDRREGPSATVGYKGSDVLKVFTSSIPELRADETYTKLGYLAATRHDGDHAAAARQLAADGYGTPAGYDHLIGEGLKARVVSSAQDAPPEPWPEPKGLPQAEPLPDFPIDALPAWMAAQVVNTANIVQCHPDLPAMFGLGALAVAALGHVQVEPTPGKIEWANLYCAIVAGVAEGKSPALSRMVGPCYEYEDHAVTAAAADVAAVETERKAIEERIKRLDSAISKEDGDTAGLKRQASEERARLATLAPASGGRLIADDITPERLATLMAENGERISIVSDEAGALNLDRYGDKSRGSNMDLYLQAWSGRPKRVDRTNGTKVQLRRPLLNFIVGAQPEAWDKVMADEEFRTRGLGQRFMAARPPQMAHLRVDDLDRDIYAPDVEEAYRGALGALCARLGAWQTPALLKLDPQARRDWSAWAARLNARTHAGGDLDHEIGWVSKLKDTTHRVAALLHLAEGGSHTEPVGPETVARTLQIADYWVAHRLHDPTGSARHAERLLGALVRLSEGAGRARRGRFAARSDLSKRGPRGLRKIEDYIGPLAQLIDAGLVRLAGGESEGEWQVSDAIRRAPLIEVHPDAEQWLQRAAARGTARRANRESIENSDEAKRAAQIAKTAKGVVLEPPLSSNTESEGPGHGDTRGACGAICLTTPFMSDPADPLGDEPSLFRAPTPETP